MGKGRDPWSVPRPVPSRPGTGRDRDGKFQILRGTGRDRDPFSKSRKGRDGTGTETEGTAGRKIFSRKLS